MKNSVRIISILLVLLLCSFMFVSCDSGDSYGSESIVPDISVDNDKLSDINGIITNGSVSKHNQDNSSLPSDSENNDNNESEYESKIIKKYWMETETKEFTNISAESPLIYWWDIKNNGNYKLLFYLIYNCWWMPFNIIFI